MGAIHAEEFKKTLPKGRALSRMLRGSVRLGNLHARTHANQLSASRACFKASCWSSLSCPAHAVHMSAAL